MAPRRPRRSRLRPRRRVRPVGQAIEFEVAAPRVYAVGPAVETEVRSTLLWRTAEDYLPPRPDVYAWLLEAV